MKKNPIGVFDSGIGGLTVLAEITRLLPLEDTFYLGDTARVPYGTKSKETVVRYSLEDASFLLRHNIKLLVVACNTASAYALSELKERLEIPVIGVIEPGARAACDATRCGRVGVIGTEGTVKSGAYSETIKRLSPSAKTFEAACPLFVPLAEEGIIEDEITTLVASRYLSGLKGEEIDTLVLGCTHYPLLKKAIAQVMGSKVTLIDSATTCAMEVKMVLSEKGLLNDASRAGNHRFFVTDSPERFVKVGRVFFGDRLNGVELAHVDAFSFKDA